MPPLDQIRESIEARLVELKAEITTLQAARAQLDVKGAGRNEGAATSSPGAGKPRRRRAPKQPANGPDPGRVKDNGRTSGSAAAGPAEPASAASEPRRQTRAKPAKAERRVEVLLAGKLEAMLAGAHEGLSAVTISKRASASYSQVLALLRELESGGQVRRTGTRRTSLWRLITEEERIAERAAELERLASSPGSSTPR